MNNISHSISRVITLISILLISYFECSAQKIEQDTINGIAYYVYPFENPLTVHSNYYVAVKDRKDQDILIEIIMLKRLEKISIKKNIARIKEKSFVKH